MIKSIFNFSAIVVLFISVISCNTETKPTPPGYTIDISIENTSMDSVFLFVLGSDGWDLIDSVKGDSGKFHFTGAITGADYIAIGDKNRNYSVKFLADNSPISITGDFEKPGEETITGSAVYNEYLAIQDSLSIFDIQMEAVIANYNAAEEANDTAALAIIESEYYTFKELKDKWLLGWVEANPKSYVSQFYIVNPLIYSVTTQELRGMFDNISPEVSTSGMYTMIENRLSILENSAVGKPAPDFTMNDSTDTPQTLSSHFGTYLLIDFWASWCGPCRAENPQMVAIYNKYHDKGYNVYGVSLDAKRDRWLQAIADDELTWDHVSDLKGWSNDAAKLYGVNSIPHTVLLDPNGVIIARGLRGDELEAKLAEVFASEVQ